MTGSASATPAAAVEALQLARENAYLKLRCRQLQEDVTNLDARVIRLQQQLDRLRSGRADPLAGSPP